MGGLSIWVWSWALLGVTSTAVVGSVPRNDSAVNTSSPMSLPELTRVVQLLQRSTERGGAMYVRWGRTSCPRVSELVYRGYAGGSWWTHPGAAVDYLCLPEDPQYGNYAITMNNISSYVYGSEYKSHNRFHNFQNHNQDVPCAVCRSPTRTTALMIPARTSCYPGMHLEYQGYLMTGYWKHPAASQYVCVDHQPENVEGGEWADRYGKLFYFVEGRCGSLQCPPYVNGRVLLCVVCSM